MQKVINGITFTNSTPPAKTVTISEEVSDQVWAFIEELANAVNEPSPVVGQCGSHRKIKFIKFIRQYACQNGSTLGLGDAKRIVEALFNGI